MTILFALGLMVVVHTSVLEIPLASRISGISFLAMRRGVTEKSNSQLVRHEKSPALITLLPTLVGQLGFMF